jgi:glycyl-tRNA synthetase beta chain
VPELLLELLSEEIPARMQDRAAADLAVTLGTSLREAQLAFEEPIAAYATPRRLTVVVRGLPERQQDRKVERKGPRTDAPEAARQGFLRSLEGQSYRLEEREEKKGKALFAVIEERGRKTPEVLAEALPEILARFPWPKSMRWGSGEARWVRPLHGILCLFDEAVVPFAFAGVESGAETRGHRFMAPEPFVVRDFADYRGKLRGARVMLDGEERKRLIRERAEALAAEQGQRLRTDEGLLDELEGLAEWPVPLLGRIDESFMALPPEVLVTSMREHQRYLALEDEEGRLAPFFVSVANIEAGDGGRAIIAGNERVLRARLWDARFFWEQDLKTPLEENLAKLDDVVFYAELGSQGERVRRLAAYAHGIALLAFGRSSLSAPEYHRLADSAHRAALLAKADLVSGMVGEFPELQGVMGAHVATAQREPEGVALAIAEHYAPRGPDDDCPSAPLSISVALADKLDMLVGFFAKGIRPTGSKDPFALRRAALGVIRLVLENGLRIPLRQAFELALQGYGPRLAGTDRQALEADLLAFFADRLKVHLRGEGVRHDLISAVFAAGADDDLVRLIARVRALQEFMATEDGANLLAGYRRASNIVTIEERKDRRAYSEAPDPALLREPAEVELYDALERAEQAIAAALEREDFAGAMAELARLRQPIDAFFDHVLVNAPEQDLRANRLRLLNRIRGSLDVVADFALVEERPTS